MKKYYNLFAIIMISGLLKGSGTFTAEEQSALNKLYANGVNLPGAIERGDINAARLLIKAGADVNSGCPIVIACGNGDMEMVKLLTEQHADVNCIHVYGNRLKFTPLMEAARCGNCGINSKDPERCKKCVEVAKFLLEHGAEVNKQIGLYTPLNWAQMNPNDSMKALLLQYGAKT